MNSNSLSASLRKLGTDMESYIASKSTSNKTNATTKNSSDSWFGKIDSTTLMYIAGGAVVLFLVLKN